MIHILDGQKDIILDYITLSNIIDDNHKKSLEDTLETYDFITFANKRFSQYLEKRNRIIIPDEDGTLQEFVIFEAHKYKDTEGYKAQVFANASYLELKKASILYPNKHTGTASEHAGRALNDTGWQVGITEGNGIKTLSINEHTNPYEFLKRIAKEFELELRFRIEHDGNKVVGRYVDLLERVGEWRGREVEFGKDLDGIRRIEKQDIVTALLGLGPEREDGTRIEVLVTDEDALQRWGRIDEHGNLKHLIEPYEIQSERTEMTEAEARQYTRTALNKRINTQVTYEATIVDLENVPGMQNKKIRFGDTIKIKDTSFNPPLYLEARLFEQNRSIKSKAKKDIKLGDFIEYTEEEVNAIWEQLKKQIKNRVSHYEMVEYTYDKLTIDDKDETVFEEGKSFAEATGIRAEENAKAFAVQEDSKIKLNAEQYANNVAEQKANSALEQAKMYAVAKTVYENQMNQIAQDIASRAPLTYVNGQLKVIEDELEDFNVTIEEKADKTTVYTIEQVDNMINNTVSKTQYETDKSGIVQQLETNGTRIGQNEHAIGLKADASYVDSVENELTRKIGNVEVKADGVITQVSEVRADLDNLEIGGRNLLQGTSNTPIKETFRQNANEYRVSESSLQELFRGGEYVASVIIDEVISAPKGVTIMLSIRNSDGSAYYQINSTETFYVGDRGRLTGYFNIPVISDPEGKYATVHLRDNYDSKDNIVIYKSIKLEKGNKATDWTPAPEDTDAQINDVRGKVETAEGEIRALAGEVSLKASQSTVNSLEQRVSTAEGELRVLPGQINAKVSRNGVIGAINATPETLLIDFNKVKMTGELEAKHIKSLAGLNVNNQFIVDSAGNVKFKGSLEGATGTFKGSIDTPMLTVGADSIRGYDKFGLRLQTAKTQESLTEPFKKTGYLVFNTLNNALELYKTDLNGNEVDMDGFRVNAKMMDFLGDVRAHGFFYSNAIDHFGGGVHLYVRPQSGGELRATVTGTTNQYVDIRGKFIYANSVDINTGTHIYIRPSSSGNLRVTATGTTSNWRPVEAGGFENRSQASIKQDIELWTESALDIINQAQIYQYRLKTDVANGIDKLKYSLVIGDGFNTPEEFLSVSGESIDVYVQTNINTKAIQELDYKINDNKDEIEWLKTENQYLKQIIKALEAKIA